MEDRKTTYIEVYRNDMEHPIAVIEPYRNEDGRHPERKFCYDIGVLTYYSDTAKTINDMVCQYIRQEIDWTYCAEHGITLRFVPHYED